MYPSSLRRFAIRTFSLDEGEITSACRARMALRMRARKSAIGSVMFPHLPARFDDARNVALQGVHSETNAAHLELAQEGAGPATLLATIAMTDPPFGRLAVHVDGFCHDQVLNGIPRWRRSARPCSSLRALVVKVMFIPLGFSRRS